MNSQTTISANPIVITKTLASGLYRLTVDADGGEFDWESLYVVLNVYGNVNERTGPWDFNLLENNRPVLPAYWTYMNGRKIGLWYFDRPSHAQIEGKRFKGEASFWIKEAGEYEFRFEPYRDFTLTWATMEFGPELEDRLADAPDLNLKADAQHGFQRLVNAERWKTLAARLADPAFPYRTLFQESIEWAKKPHREPAESTKPGNKSYSSIPLSLLASDYLLTGNRESLGFARTVIEYLLSLPVWGNPREDGYGHNGDMAAAHPILDMALAVNLLGDALEKPLIARVLERVERQGDIFLEMALLHRGYWGGSIMQDHGFCSFSWLTTAAYALVGWTPKAEEWLRFCMPRMRRTFQALPTDGVVPQTSYHLLFLYTDKVVLLRELHRQATGEDIYELPCWRNVPKYAFDSYVPETGQLLHVSPRGDLTRFYGGHPFLDQMARSFRDEYAGWLSREYARLVSSKGLYHGVQEQAMFAMTLWAALLWEPVDLPAPARPPRTLSWFRDTGALMFRDEKRALLLSTRCGSSNGLNARRNTSGPCDRITLAPMSGTFALTKHGVPLIQTAEGGYKMRTELGNIVLVDGQGQLGDHGPPMCCPDAPYGGEHIVEAALDEKSGRGHALMDLTGAYDPALGIRKYTREWFFEADGRLRLVDRIAANAPRRFSWLFHTYKSHPIESAGKGAFAIRSGTETLRLALAGSSSPLGDSIADTHIVWGYCNENDNLGCHHLKFENAEPLQELSVEFVLD